MQKEKILKVPVLGDASVGKTTLIKRFIENKFETSTMTIGIDILSKKVELDGRYYTMQIWDVGGQERFRFMLDEFLRGVDGALILFDISNFKSFVNIDKWVEIVRSQNAQAPLILVASKYDLKNFSLVGDILAKATSEKNNLQGYIKTSAKEGVNVKKPFYYLARTIVNKFHKQEILCMN